MNLKVIVRVRSQNGQMNKPLKSFRLNEWTVVPSECVVRKGAHSVHLEPRVMEVLAYLAEHRDRVISIEELRRRLWGESFVVKQAITRCVCQIRRAFADDFRAPRFVATFPKRGYRLVGELDLSASAPQRLPAHRLMAWGIALVLLLLIALVSL